MEGCYAALDSANMGKSTRNLKTVFGYCLLGHAFQDSRFSTFFTYKVFERYFSS